MIRSRYRTTICIVLLTLAAGGLRAQDIFLGGRLGALGGAVWFEYDEAGDMVKPKLGLQIGGVAAYRLNSFLSLQAELWYVQKGWTETPAGGTRRLGYLELPLFVVAMAPWRTAPQLVVGAAVSREVACSVGGIPDVGSLSCSASRVEWHHAKEQFGIWFGLGGRRRFAASYLEIQFLGNVHLTDLNREPLLRGYDRLISFVLSATYMIPIGGKKP